MPPTLANGKICYIEMPATDAALVGPRCCRKDLVHNEI